MVGPVHQKRVTRSEMSWRMRQPDRTRQIVCQSVRHLGTWTNEENETEKWEKKWTVCQEQLFS